ncbi:hypothetical protein PENSTE_c014G06107 [Penicillium steckii]|uniref:Uncharacterized protein n=1 Tax=Penicillium steckii TaxID=303698 RepID=A0A1V6T0I2_9EURO|nr:hypothetical protein PENSTE_c014G06107 [Penicillium steckii]
MATPSGSGDKDPAPATTPAPPSETPQNQSTTQPRDDDEDSDFDELDDVLDDFSKPKSQPAPPTAPADTTGSGAAPPDFDEDAFLKQLEKDMANMMGGAGAAPGVAAGAGAGPANASAEGADFQNFQQSIDQGADAFTKKLEESGIPPGDFLKQLLADVMAEEGGSGAGAGASAAADLSAVNTASTPAAPSTSENNSEQPAESFNEAIQRTMERMKDSGNRATEAASTDDGLSDDMLAQLLKAVEAGSAGGGEDGDLTKMFMGMMEQLSNKEMLYEPMKELDGKFGPWIEKNKAENKVSAEDMERYEKQARIVNQIVTKFEENGYSDENPKCREYVWERMQEVRLVIFPSVVEAMVEQDADTTFQMQAAGSPPEELISNPLMGEMGGAAAGAMPEGMPDCPQQ